jgi:hypothetical protein
VTDAGAPERPVTGLRRPPIRRPPTDYPLPREGPASSLTIR